MSGFHYVKTLYRATISSYRNKGLLLRPFWRFPTRSIHKSRTCLAKTYYDDRENMWASEILNRLGIDESPAKSSLSCNSLGTGSSRTSEVVCRFADLSREYKDKGLSVEDAAIGDTCEELCMEMPEMTDQELVDSLFWLCAWKPPQNTRTPRFKAVWNSLDWECHRRCEAWPVEQLLRVGHMWFALRLSRITLFNKKMIDLLCHQLDRLQYRQVIQLLFYVNLQREVGEGLMRDVESKLLSFEDDMTADDMAVAAMAFFKTKTPARSSELIFLAIKKLEESLEAGSNITVSALAKFLKKSANRNFVKAYGIAQERCVPFVSRFNPTTATHLAMMATRLNFCNGKLLHSVVGSFPCDLTEVRLKELTKLAYCLATYAPHESYCLSFCDTAIKELLKPAREEEIQLHPENLVSISLYLAYVDRYHIEFVRRVLETSFIKRLEDKQGYMYHRELYVLRRSIALDRPHWKINELPKDFEAKMMKASGRIHNIDSLFHNSIDEIGSIINSLIGGKVCKKQRIMPHYILPDLVFSTENGKPTEFHERSPEKFAVVYGGHQFYTMDTKQHLGFSIMKMRHLKAIGCKVVEVPGFKYLQLRREQKRPFIRELLSQHGVTVRK